MDENQNFTAIEKKLVKGIVTGNRHDYMEGKTFVIELSIFMIVAPK